VALFVVVRDGSVHDFDHVAEPHELKQVPLDASKPVYRTDTLDIYVAAQGLADNLLRAVEADLKAYLATAVPPVGRQRLSGASV
jgi:hypothetical protein